MFSLTGAGKVSLKRGVLAWLMISCLSILTSIPLDLGPFNPTTSAALVIPTLHHHNVR